MGQALSLREISGPQSVLPPSFVPISQQEPPIPVFVALIAEHTQSLCKRPVEPLTIALLHRQRLLASRRLRLPLVDFRRHLDARTTFKLRARRIHEARLD